jgi:hypothetical protein
MVLDFVFAHPIISLVAGVVLYFVAKSVLFSSKPVKRSIPKGKYNDKVSFHSTLRSFSPCGPEIIAKLTFFDL